MHLPVSGFVDIYRGEPRPATQDIQKLSPTISSVGQVLCILGYPCVSALLPGHSRRVRQLPSPPCPPDPLSCGNHRRNDGLPAVRISEDLETRIVSGRAT